MTAPITGTCLTCGDRFETRGHFSAQLNAWVYVGSCPTCKCIRTEGVGVRLDREIRVCLTCATFDRFRWAEVSGACSEHLAHRPGAEPVTFTPIVGIEA